MNDVQGIATTNDDETGASWNLRLPPFHKRIINNKTNMNEIAFWGSLIISAICFTHDRKIGGWMFFIIALFNAITITFIHN